MKIISVVSLIALLIISPIAPILVSNLPSIGDPGYIIQFGDTREEQIAIDELKSLNQGIKIVNFDEIETIISLMTSKVFLVGHGSDLGIQYDNDIIAWSTINNLILNIPAKHISYVSCNSYKAAQLAAENGKRVFGFQKDIEVVLAARAASLMAAADTADADSFMKFYPLVRERVAELGSLDEVLTLPLLDPGTGGGGGGSGGGSGDDDYSCRTYSHWYSEAAARIPGGSSDEDKVNRGYAITGSYADLYWYHTSKFLWAGLAAYVSFQATAARHALHEWQINDPDGTGTFDALLLMAAVLIAIIVGIFAGIAAFLITLIVMAVIYVVGGLVTDFGWTTGQATDQVFDLLTDLNDAIFANAVWGHLAYEFGGYICIERTIDQSPIPGDYGDDAKRFYLSHFDLLSGVNQDNTVQGAKDFLVFEQYYAAHGVYQSYSSDVLSALTGQTKIAFQSDSTERKFKDDMIDAGYSNPYLGDRDQRVTWANEYLIPTFVNLSWFTSGVDDDMAEFYWKGIDYGGNY